MNKNSNDITEKPYAEWLDGEILSDICTMPMRALAMTGITEDGRMFNNYCSASVADKILMSNMEGFEGYVKCELPISYRGKLAMHIDKL